MFDWLKTLLLPVENPTVTNSLVAIMLAIATGIFFGRLKLGKITFGVSAVMFTGLLLGHFGYRIQPGILDFIRDYEYSSTCNTMGSSTEYGWLPAFSVELNDNDNIECLYVSLLFDEKLDDEIMETIENQIKEAIEEGDVSEEMFKINK